MNNQLMLPASCCALKEEEMVYLTGGEDSPFYGEDTDTTTTGEVTTNSVSALLGLFVGSIYIYNYVWGLNETRNWLKKNKTGNVFQTTAKAADAAVDYISSSVVNSVRGVLTAMQFTTLWPITAVAWLTV